MRRWYNRDRTWMFIQGESIYGPIDIMPGPNHPTFKNIFPQPVIPECPRFDKREDHIHWAW